MAEHPEPTRAISTEDLALLEDLAGRAAAATPHPSWARRLTEAAHVARLMVDEATSPDTPDLDGIRRQLGEVKAALAARQDHTAGGE